MKFFEWMFGCKSYWIIGSIFALIMCLGELLAKEYMLASISATSGFIVVGIFYGITYLFF